MSAVATRSWCRMYGCSEQPADGGEFCLNHQHAANEEPVELEEAAEPGAAAEPAVSSSIGLTWHELLRATDARLIARRFNVNGLGRDGLAPLRNVRVAGASPAGADGKQQSRPEDSEREPQAQTPPRRPASSRSAASRSDDLLRALALAARAFADALLEETA